MPGIQSLTGACDDNADPPHQPGDHLALVSDLLSLCTLPAAKGNTLQRKETWKGSAGCFIPHFWNWLCHSTPRHPMSKQWSGSTFSLEWVRRYFGCGQKRHVAEGVFWGTNGLWVRHGLYTSTVFFPIARRTKTGFLPSGKVFETLVLLLLHGDETAAHPEVYIAPPHSPVLQHSVRCSCWEGETGSGNLKHSRRKYFLQKDQFRAQPQPKIAHRISGIFREEAEQSRGCWCVDWGGGKISSIL